MTCAINHYLPKKIHNVIELRTCLNAAMFLKEEKKQMAQNFWHFSKRFSRDFSKWPKPNRYSIKVDLMSTYELLLSIYQFSCVSLSQTISMLKIKMHKLDGKTFNVTG